MTIIPHDFINHDTVFWPIVEKLKKTERIIDIGAGVRPCLAFPCEEYIAIEPHAEYADILREEWHPKNQAVTVVIDEAEAVANYPRQGTTVLLLDVIEHLEKPRGERLRDLLEEFEQAIIFTPLGFVEQTTDNWGLHGEYWQTHRSGWKPKDFANWQVEIWPTFFIERSSVTGALLALRQG